MRFSPAFLSLSLAISVSASPTPTSIANAVTSAECVVVNAVVQVLKLLPTTSPFCSSFLSIQTSTSTVTRITTVPTTTTLSTITGTNTMTAAAVTVSSATTTTVTTCLPANLINKRNLEKREKSTSKSTSTFHTSSTSTKTTSIPSPSCTIPAVLSMYQSAAISTACECLGITTPTLTVTASATAISTIIATTNLAVSTTVTPTSIVISTVTSVATACPTPDTSCNNAGVQYAVWYNSQGENSDFTYPNFDPTLYKSDNAEFTANSSTDMIGPINTGSCNTGTCSPGYVYSTYTSSVGLVTVDHRGYLFAPLDGVYTITINGNDNIVLVWIRDLAYSGWTRANAVLEGTWPNPPSSTTVTLNAGEWFPIRVMYANGGGPGSFSVTITAPDGTEIAGSDENSSPFLVQYSCDGRYPQYPPWNSES